VDFQYFPRRLAKAETFGTGLMDVGPGLFVFSSGLSLGLRLLRGPAHSGAKSPSNTTLSLLGRAARSVGPIALLGAARLVLTKAVDYQASSQCRGVLPTRAAAALMRALLQRCKA
jgi:glucosaminylphosphatidylinositol acyltransferase